MYEKFDTYYRHVNGKNSAAYYARKATKRGYVFAEIDRNDHIEEIHRINMSAPVRQGREMSPAYRVKRSVYEKESHMRCFGVKNKNGILVSYCVVGFYGEFALLSVLLGHKRYLNDGIMYLMITEVVRVLYKEYVPAGCNYLMYDTFFGASDGLRRFKSRLGFEPYNVQWVLDV
jgi:hypothetical protein